jgi:hypothetical protein
MVEVRVAVVRLAVVAVMVKAVSLIRARLKRLP